MWVGVMAFGQIAYYIVFGKPLLFHTGVIAFLAMFVAAAVPFLNQMNLTRISMKWHHYLAAVAVIFAIIHVVLAI